MGSSNNAQSRVQFTLNGKTVDANAGDSILTAAKRHGVEIPHLCYKEGLAADGNCRACVVEIDGERTLAPSCCRNVEEGMTVSSTSERSVSAQKMVLELLGSDMPDKAYRLDDELKAWQNEMNVDQFRFDSRQQPQGDESHPAIAVNLDACIQCTRCVRACRDIQGNDVIGLAHRGGEVKIVFDLGDDLGASTCVSCGECVQACPTGALAPANGSYLEKADKTVDSTCPYCGVGCLLTYHVKDNRILRVEGRNGAANENRLCVKGRYGFDYPNNPERLLKPLIRRDDAPKQAEVAFDPAHPEKWFREASWEEAMERAVGGIDKILKRDGPSALAGFGSAKGSNEEAYLFQKLIRIGFGTNNIDHCTRLCHASSVTALIEGVASGAVSNQVEDCADSDVIVVIGSNPANNHPVAATFMKNAVRRGAKLVLMDPRKTVMARYAEHTLQFKPDTDVALLNALLHIIIEEDLVDHAFIKERVDNFDAIRDNVRNCTPEAMSQICGIEPETLREVARLYATAKNAIIFWGMGVSQHTHGTDNVRCLIALCMICGQIGRRGTGLHPLRGQNNVQGASDAGLIPMYYPDYQSVADKAVRERFEKAWGAELDPTPGLTVVEIMHRIEEGVLKGAYVMGENPAMSDPNLNHTRTSLSMLEHLVVQDIFLTETAHYADVVLPASTFAEKTGTFTNTDRRVQLGRQVVDAPGEVRKDIDIIIEFANRMGLDWHYADVGDVFEEMRSVMPSIAGISWQRLNDEDSVIYPCADENDPGKGVVFTTSFPTKNGRAQLVPADFTPADEVPDDEYPMVLITGRQLEHWHTGSMTRRSYILDSIEPEAVVYMNPQDMEAMEVNDGDMVQLESRRGSVHVKVRQDPGSRQNSVFLPFCYHEAAANLLTNEALDPFGKIPEFKYCAVRVV